MLVRMVCFVRERYIKSYTHPQCTTYHLNYTDRVQLMSQRQPNSLFYISSNIWLLYLELILILRCNLMYTLCIYMYSMHAAERTIIYDVVFICNFPKGIFLFDSIIGIHTHTHIQSSNVHFTIWPIYNVLTAVRFTRYFRSTIILYLIFKFAIIRELKREAEEKKPVNRVPNLTDSSNSYV